MLQADLITRSFDLFLSLFWSVALLPPTLTWPGPGLPPSRLVLVELSAPPGTAGSEGTSLITQAKGLVRHFSLYCGFLGAAFSSAQPWLSGARGSQQDPELSDTDTRSPPLLFHPDSTFSRTTVSLLLQKVHLSTSSVPY